MLSARRPNFDEVAPTTKRLSRPVLGYDAM